MASSSSVRNRHILPPPDDIDSSFDDSDDSDLENDPNDDCEGEGTRWDHAWEACNSP
eukprot:NODE_14629_length_339_cov_2.462069_g13466_i0.p2 GENE.NODE_14629_length_339_cov_2.462069_g13466_i0~~NODE_14629_length_339_cov_2.462069_g13466_i0.p2  ORF type:complete len:57 (-),score=8.65 NODE_14629_length_339_cov_2.462069_g13466_i0:20-190(-)